MVLKGKLVHNFVFFSSPFNSISAFGFSSFVFRTAIDLCTHNAQQVEISHHNAAAQNENGNNTIQMLFDR